MTDVDLTVNPSAPTRVDGLAEVAYFGHPALSCSGAKLLLPPNSPALFHWGLTHPRPDKPQFDFGHAAHARVLGVGAPIVAVPDEILASNGALSTKEAKAFVAEHKAAGETVLKQADLDVVDAMADAVRAHPVTSQLFKPEAGDAEVSLFWHDESAGLDRRARLDWLMLGGGRPLIADVKTADSADPRAFARAVASYSYHMQHPWYVDGVSALTGSDDVAMVFVVIEKNPPYQIVVAELDSLAVMIGREKNKAAMSLYLDCVTNDVWPGYADDAVVSVGLPQWADREYMPF